MAKPRNFTPDENAPLVDLLRQGDSATFETLVRKYVKRMYNLVYLLGGNGAIATDATRNAFVASWREVKSLRSTTHFSIWLLILLLREYRSLTAFGAGGDNGTELPPAPRGEVIATGEGAELSLQERLRSYLRSLSQEQALVLVLHYARGYRLDRMAEILQIREDVILGRLFTAREQLATLLKHGAAFPPRQGGELRPGHEEIRRCFPAYLDNSAEEKEKELIRRHLGECGSCRESLAELEWIAEHLKSLPDVDPPAGLVPAVMAAVRAETPVLLPASPAYNPFPEGKWVIVAVIVAAVAIYWYLAPHESGNAPEVEKTLPGAVDMTVPAKRPMTGSEKGVSPPLLPPLQVRGGAGTPTGRTAPPEAPVAPVTVPHPAVTSPAPPRKQTAPAAPSMPVQPAKPAIESPPALPPDWGEGATAGRSLSRKAATRGRSGEISVLLGVNDHDRSPEEIERAVTALGGTVTGRGYSGGRDILYTRIDVDNVMELVKRLAKVGTVIELPQIPDGASGPIDLVIRW